DKIQYVCSRIFAVKVDCLRSKCIGAGSNKMADRIPPLWRPRIVAAILYSVQRPLESSRTLIRLIPKKGPTTQLRLTQSGRDPLKSRDSLLSGFQDADLGSTGVALNLQIKQDVLTPILLA